MIATEKIIEKITNQCENEHLLKKLLIQLLDFETLGKGWWKEDYKKILDECIMEEHLNEN